LAANAAAWRWAAATAASPGSASPTSKTAQQVGLHLGLVVDRHLGQGIAGAVDQAPLAQAGWKRPVEGAGQPRSAVADRKQRHPQPAMGQIGEEVVPGVGRL
jgi:hypothetical protein